MLLALAALHRALLRWPLIYFLEAHVAESNFKAKAIVRLAIELPSNSDFSSSPLGGNMADAGGKRLMPARANRGAKYVLPRLRRTSAFLLLRRPQNMINFFLSFIFVQNVSTASRQGGN